MGPPAWKAGTRPLAVYSSSTDYTFTRLENLKNFWFWHYLGLKFKLSLKIFQPGVDFIKVKSCAYVPLWCTKDHLKNWALHSVPYAQILWKWTPSSFNQAWANPEIFLLWVTNFSKYKLWKKLFFCEIGTCEYPQLYVFKCGLYYEVC